MSTVDRVTGCALVRLAPSRDDRRGEGLGMALLRHCLDRIDTERVAAYLESSNPANDHRYERPGFVRTGQFRMPAERSAGGAEVGPVVATMWRPAQRTRRAFRSEP